MNRFNSYHNNRYLSEDTTNFSLNEISKESNHLNPNYSLGDKNFIDKSLKDLRRDIKKMSENIQKLNNETNEFIRNKNKVKNFRSFSYNGNKIIPNQGDVLRNTKQILNNNLVLNEFAYNNMNNNNINLKSFNNYYLKNYENEMQVNLYKQNIDKDIFYKPNQNTNHKIIRYFNYKKNKSNILNNNTTEPKKIYNIKNSYENNQNFPRNAKNNNLRALSVDFDNLYKHSQNQDKKLNNILSEKNILLKEKNEAKNQIDNYISQIMEKDILIEKLKEEIKKTKMLRQSNDKTSKKTMNNSEHQQILRKNKDLIEENEKLKLKIKNQIENDKKIIKDKIKNNIKNNIQNEDVIKQNNQMNYWKKEYDKLYVENMTLKKSIENLTK